MKKTLSRAEGFFDWFLPRRLTNRVWSRPACESWLAWAGRMTRHNCKAYDEIILGQIKIHYMTYFGTGSRRLLLLQRRTRWREIIVLTLSGWIPIKTSSSQLQSSYRENLPLTSLILIRGFSASKPFTRTSHGTNIPRVRRNIWYDQWPLKRKGWLIRKIMNSLHPG